MIVILNQPSFLGATQVAHALCARLEQSSVVDGHAVLERSALGQQGTLEQRLFAALEREVRQQIDAGCAAVVLSYAFYEPEPLGRLRRQLAPLDDEIYAFRLRHDPEQLARQHDQGDLEALSDLLDLWRQWQAAVDQGALRGDMGYELQLAPGPDQLLGADDAELWAAAIWDDIHQPVQLTDYDPDWPAQFAKERRQVLEALGPLALSLEHVGSTAVPGLCAKPILDLLLSVAQLDQAPRCIPALSRLGYSFIDYPQNRDRRFFRKGTPRSHHIQLVQRGSAAERGYLRFRDALRTDAALCDEYARLKRTAASQLSRQRAAYGEQKSALVRRVLGGAVARD